MVSSPARLQKTAFVSGSVLIASALMLGLDGAAIASAKSPDDRFLAEVEDGGQVTGSSAGLLKLGRFVCQTMTNWKSEGFSSVYKAEDYADESLQRQGLTMEAAFDIIVAAENNLCPNAGR